MAIAAAAVAFNVNMNLNKSDNQLSHLALASVEALGHCEVYNVLGKLEFQCSGAGNCKKTINGLLYTCTGTLVTK